MDLQSVFCPNLDCAAGGRVDEGNIGIHSRKDQRNRCRVCEKTFTARAGTAFYWLRTAEEAVTLVVTLLAHGCPLQAIVVALGFDERTVQAWHRRAGRQCHGIQAYLVQRPRDLGQVQAGEVWVKLQGVKVWMATPALALLASAVRVGVAGIDPLVVWTAIARRANDRVAGWSGFRPTGPGAGREFDPDRVP